MSTHFGRGLSPFNVEAMAFEAGRIRLNRIEQLMAQEVDFAIETTLSTRSYMQTIRRAQQIGYSVNLYYFWIPSADVSKERVAMRVSLGGHNIPSDVIERRYERSVATLIKLYIPISNHFAVFNNAGVIPEMIVTGGMDIGTYVLNKNGWEIIVNYEHNSGKIDTN